MFGGQRSKYFTPALWPEPAANEWNQHVLIVAGLKAHASILLFSCSANKLASMLGSRQPALRLLEDKGQSIVFLHLSQSLASKTDEPDHGWADTMSHYHIPGPD